MGQQGMDFEREPPRLWRRGEAGERVIAVVGGRCLVAGFMGRGKVELWRRWDVLAGVDNSYIMARP